MESIYAFDFSILNFLQEHSNAFFDFFFSIITHLGDGGIFWMTVTAIMLCFRKTRKAGLCMGVGLLLGLIVCNITIKPFVLRIRPYYNLDWSPLRTADTLLVKAPPDTSFPSAHAASSFEAALGMFYFHKKGGAAALIIAVLIAFSRIYLYLHYPTDVFAGIAIGCVLSVAAFFIVKRFEKTKLGKKIL